MDRLLSSALDGFFFWPVVALADMQMHIPIVNAWQLNERHYGGLTGLDKQETVEKHGIDQVLFRVRYHGTLDRPRWLAGWLAGWLAVDWQSLVVSKESVCVMFFGLCFQPAEQQQLTGASLSPTTIRVQSDAGLMGIRSVLQRIVSCRCPWSQHKYYAEDRGSLGPCMLRSEAL